MDAATRPRPIDGAEVPPPPAAGEEPCVDIDEVCVPAVIDLPRLLQRAVAEAARLLGVDAAVLYLFDRSTGLASWTYDAGIVDEDVRAGVRDTKLRIGEGMVGLVLAHRVVFVTDDYEHDPRIWTTDRERRSETATLLGIRSAVAAPLRGSAEPLGVLCVFTRVPRTFTEAEIALVRALADHAALALENARLNGELLASDSRYRALLHHAPDAIWSADREGRFTYVSDTAEGLVGWRPDELVGQSWDLVNDESTVLQVRERLAWSVEHPTESQIFRCNLRHRDGHAVPVEINATGMAIDGHWSGAIGSVRDMSDRDRLERELQEQAAELAAGQERTMLAQELHDSVTQALFSITLTTGTAEILLGRGALDGVAVKLQELRDLSTDALAEMRALIFELQPESLMQLGLEAALHRHVDALRGRTGLPARLEIEGVGRLPRAIEEGLYRVAQEALHNVVKHAAASLVLVRVERRGDDVELSVTDNGVGFDPTQVRGEHLGLVGMGVRATRMRGRLRIDSHPGAGTRITLVVPLEASPSAE